MKIRLFIPLIIIFAVASWAFYANNSGAYMRFGATPVFTVYQGGTGSSSLYGILKGNGGSLESITDNSSNWNTAYSWGNHAGLYDVLGQATATKNLLLASNNTWTGGQTFGTATSSATLFINQICNTAGICFDSPSTQGSAVEFFPSNGDADIATYENMFTYPTGTTTVDESCSADSDIAGGYCNIDTYISTTTDISILTYPAGITEINAYTYVSSATGISKLEFTGFKRTSGGVETFLGQATTTEIDHTSTALYLANFTGTIASAFNTNGTDRLVMKVRGWTDSNVAKTIHWTYQNSGEYSHIKTPITTADIGHARVYANETITGVWTHTGQFIADKASTTQLSVSGNSWLGSTITLPNGIWSADGRVGIGTSTFYQSTIIGIASTTNTYLQGVMRNSSNGTNASSEWALENDRGTDTNYYSVFGINSSGFNNSLYTLMTPNSAYLYNQDGDLTVGTASSSAGSLIFHTGGTLTKNTRMTIDKSGYVFINLPNTNVGSTTPDKQVALNDPWTIPVATTANYGATYSDNITRTLVWGTATSSSLYMRNTALAASLTGIAFVGSGSQYNTLANLFPEGSGTGTKYSLVGRGAITYRGYHYMLTASTTSASYTKIKRAISADNIMMDTSYYWATTTISGVSLPTTAFIVGASDYGIYIATTTTGIQLYTVSTSTNTLTSSTYYPISGANILVTNTRVNNNGMYIGFNSSPYIRKYTLNGVAVTGILNYGSAAPSTTGPDFFAMPYSVYALSGISNNITRITGF